MAAITLDAVGKMTREETKLSAGRIIEAVHPEDLLEVLEDLDDDVKLDLAHNWIEEIEG